MKKNIKVIEINGFRGIFVVVYALICAGAGFILFPAWAFMSMWNWIGTYVYYLPKMTLLHGFMIYVAAVLVYIATNPNKSSFGISTVNLTKSHIAAIMKDVDDDK